MNRQQVKTIETKNMLADEAVEPQFVVVKHFEIDFNGCNELIAQSIEPATYKTTDMSSIVFKGSYIECLDFHKKPI